MSKEEMFKEWLDEIFPTVEIAGITFYPSDILKECDPIAFRCMFSDWESELEFEFAELEEV